MNISFIDRDSREWARMWSALEAIYGDRVCENPRSGEVWQYMGTVRDPEGPGFRHEFRHRDYPGAGRIYARIPASLDWRQEGSAA